MSVRRSKQPAPELAPGHLGNAAGIATHLLGMFVAGVVAAPIVPLIGTWLVPRKEQWGA